MLPANQHAGFGDLSLNSHPISHFNSAQVPFSYPNPTKFHLQSHDPKGGEEEEDEWAVYASTRVASREKIGSADLQAGPTRRPEDNADEWGLFVASSVADPANHTNFPDIANRKVENGGLQVGPAQNGEDRVLFTSSTVESQPKANGSNPVSSNMNSISSEILNRTDTGGLQAGLTQNEDWGLFTSYTGSTTELNSTLQTSDEKDSINNLQANPSQIETLVEEEDEEWGTFLSTPVAPQANNNDSNDTITSSFNYISQRKLGIIDLHVRPIDYEEEWGEFVSSPVAAGVKTDVTNNTSASPSVKWEKPKGPIPLSFFGGKEEELVQEEIKFDSLPNLRPHSDSFSDVSPSNSSGVIKEIVLNPYGGIENLELKRSPSSKVCVVIFAFMLLLFSRIEIAARTRHTCTKGANCGYSAVFFFLLSSHHINNQCSVKQFANKNERM
jgi:hypothetical protein